MQRFRVLHADATRHGPDGEIGCLEQPPRRLDTKRLDEDRRRRAGLTPEGASERARAHAAPRRQRVNGEILVEVKAAGVCHSDLHPARGDWPMKTPVVLAMVELEEGPRILTNLVGVAPDPKQIRCDMPVEVCFEKLTDQVSLPMFRPVGGGAR